VKFYRRLPKIQAITFDLDDTLYSNRPVMVNAERAMISYFADKLAAKNDHNLTFDRTFWWPFRSQAMQASPQISHDVTVLRVQTYRLGILSLGYSEQQAEQYAEQALNFFLEQRSTFTIPQSSFELLDYLASKYPLVAISNGNVDTDKVGLTPYFKHFLHASVEHQRKPSRQMFDKAASLLSLPSQHILHVGDCGKADILGAHRAQMPCAWLSSYDVGKPVFVLPHVELTDITQLSSLF